MYTKIKTLIAAAVIATSALFCTVSVTLPTYATADICSNSNVPPEVKKASGCSTSEDTLPATIQAILNSVIAILGVVAVVFIVIGGVGYMTSTGDSGKLKKAKDTILYATIGLAVCALAAAIVNFTIAIINNSNSSTTTTTTTTTEEQAQEASN